MFATYLQRVYPAAMYINVYVPASSICTNSTIYTAIFCNFPVSASDIHPNTTANQTVMFPTVPSQVLPSGCPHLRLCALPTASFLAQLRISLPAESISLTYDLMALSFKSTVTIYLLSLSSFYTAFLNKYIYILYIYIYIQFPPSHSFHKILIKSHLK